MKDNIDVAGLPTTAACPAFAYRPEAHASVVARLVAAGALVVGKTNLDQFATGLVGVRSPYGVARRTCSTIASSSAAPARARRSAVAAGLVSFALGTDTAGSGRVPAAFNNIVGLKPSRGLLSTTGVVPACRSLDCVSVFALTVEDAVAVADVARGFDAGDPASRPEADAFRFAPAPRPPRFRFGVPAGAALDFLGDGRAAELLRARASSTSRRWAASGSTSTSRRSGRAGGLLYDGAFVAERLEAAGGLLAENPAALVAPVRDDPRGATRFDARAAFAAQHRLARLRRRAGALLVSVDFLFVPTTPTIYPIDEVEASPLALNALLGTLRELREPAGPGGDGGSRSGSATDGLPGGATLIAPWGRDASLATFGVGAAPERRRRRWARPTRRCRRRRSRRRRRRATIAFEIAVVGAHLSGEPLNHQLIELGGAVRARGPHRARLPAVRAAGHHRRPSPA